MGSFVGHVAPGFGFFLIGLWHLFNHIKLHALNPKSYTAFPWFPTSRIKYAELYLIMIASSISISMELFIGPDRHQPLDPDGTIPSNHLQNFEHSNISLTLFVYAAFSIALDRLSPPARYGLTYFLGAVAFGQQLLVFHLHSADHMGVEGQYHFLLQIAIFTSLLTTLLGINFCRSFLVSFVRSVSIVLQGVWLMVMGFMLWTPGLIAKGCFMNLEKGHRVVRCHGEEALERAKSLVNIQFSWYVVGVVSVAMTLYFIVIKVYGSGKIEDDDEYESLISLKNNVDKEDENDGGEDYDVEAQKIKGCHQERFLIVGKPYAPMDVER